MIKLLNYLFFLFIIFHTNAYGLGNPSLSERIWIKQNILKQEANLIFIISAKKEMFENNLIAKEKTDKDVYDPIDYKTMTKEKLKVHISINPPKKNNLNALLSLANLEILSADFKNARLHIDSAYSLEPLNTEIYLSELLYQLYFGLLQLNTAMNDNKHAVLSFSGDFFIQAEAEHPDFEIPKTIHHALNVFQAFYTVIFRHIEQFKQRKTFKFILDERLIKSTRDSKQYFLKLIHKKHSNDYFSQLCLLMIAVIENDTLSTKKYYQQLSSHPESDNNLHRLMTISLVSQANFSQAIKVLNVSVTRNDNINDRQMLASLYSFKRNQHQALKVLMDYEGKVTQSLLIDRLGYTLLTGDFVAANQLNQQYKNYPALLQQPQFIYYSLIIELLNGNQESVHTHLKSLSNSNKLYVSGQNFIDYFERFSD